MTIARVAFEYSGRVVESKLKKRSEICPTALAVLNNEYLHGRRKFHPVTKFNELRTVAT
jgi:hypothetical protein